jgi:hypothetical protein
MVAKVRERLVVRKQMSHKFHTERISYKQLNEAEQNRVQVSDMFTAFSNLHATVDNEIS